MKKVILNFLWEYLFFGLTNENKEDILEEQFILMYYIGFTWTDVRKLPVGLRKWFLKRFIKEVSKDKNDNPAPIKASHVQTPETRLFQGSHRYHSPNRLNRPI